MIFREQLFALLLLLSFSGFSQYVDGSLLVRIDSLPKTFAGKSNHNFRFEGQLFPASKNPYLLGVYKVSYEGDFDLIKDGIKSILKIKDKDIIRIPETEDQVVYDPSDYLWQEYIAGNNDWLWHLDVIDAPEAWDITKGDSNVKIAVIDTWFDASHPDLDGELAYTYDPYDPSKDFTQTNCTVSSHSHGTMVAGFAAGKTDGGGQTASVGFNCKIIPYRAHGIDFNTYLAKAHHASLTMGAKVITSSAGGWRCDSIYNTIHALAVKEILDNGTSIVMPAGNGNGGAKCIINGDYRPFKPLSPEYDERIIMVTSTNKNDYHDNNGEIHSYFPEVDVCSPGYGTFGLSSTFEKPSGCNSNSCCATVGWPYSGWGTGTSFATPIVAGIVGLMYSVNPCITPSEAQEYLKSTTDPVADAGTFSGLIGTGRVNAYKAVKRAGTAYIQNEIINSDKHIAIGYQIFVGNNVTNEESTGDVLLKTGKNLMLEAKNEVTLDKGFTMELGSTLEIDVDEQLIPNCY